MVKTLRLLMPLVLAAILVAAASLPTPDDGGYFDKELNRDLINWLASARYAQTLNNPCRYYAANTLTAPMPKRNSELINSLLSLPKNMNDAGK